MVKRSDKAGPLLRREKATADADAWHTLQVGVPIAVALFIVLPFVFYWLEP